MNWKYRHTVLTLCMLAFFVTYFARLAISPVVPFIVDDFQVTNTTIGIALSGMWLAYGASQFPSGLLADRFGERRVILVAIGGTTTMSLLLALTPVFIAFVGVAVFLGLLAGLHYAVATTLLSRTFDDLGTALGFHSIGGPLAGLVAPVTAAWVGVRYGWRPAVALSAIVGVPIFLLFLWRVRPTEPRRPDERIRDRVQLTSIISLVTRPSILLPLVLAMIGTYVTQAVLSFLPTFLVETRAYSPEFAGVVFAAIFVVRAAAQIFVGRVSDRVGRDVGIGMSMFAGALGMAGFVVLPGLFGVAVAVVLAGIGTSFFSAIDPRFIDALGEAERGAGFGLVRTVYTVIGASGSVGAGLAADLYGWDVSFTILAALFGVAFVVLAANTLLRTGY